MAHGRRPGFSLLELLIASGILGLGLIMVGLMFPVALNQHRVSAHRVMATQTALGAKRLVQTHLVPHIDPLRRYRGDNSWPTVELGPDPRDVNGNAMLDVDELAPRGPIRWDAPNSVDIVGASHWHLMHFETLLIKDGKHAGAWSTGRLDQPDLSYADELNGAPEVLNQNRPAWFRVGDTISPPVRFPDGGLESGVAGELAESSFVWYVFYQRPALSPLSTKLAYYVAVCRMNAGASFAFQDLQRSVTWPEPASTNVLSRLPMPWLVRIRASEGAPAGVLEEFDGMDDTWPGRTRLSQLAPRGAQLLGQRTGTVYSVVRSPASQDSRGIFQVSVLPLPPTEDANGNEQLDPGEDGNGNDKIDALDESVWLFPPPVVVVADEVVWQPRSPFVTGLQF